MQRRSALGLAGLGFRQFLVDLSLQVAGVGLHDLGLLGVLEQRRDVGALFVDGDDLSTRRHVDGRY